MEIILTLWLQPRVETLSYLCRLLSLQHAVLSFRHKWSDANLKPKGALCLWSYQGHILVDMNTVHTFPLYQMTAPNPGCSVVSFSDHKDYIYNVPLYILNSQLAFVPVRFHLKPYQSDRKAPQNQTHFHLGLFLIIKTCRRRLQC